MTLEELAKENNIDINELKVIEAQTRKNYSGISASVLPPETVEKYVSIAIKNYAEKIKNLNLTSFFGIILSATQPKDGVAKRRTEIMQKYIEDPVTVIASGLVQEIKDGAIKSLVKGVVTSKAFTGDIPKTAMYLTDKKVYIVPLDNRETWPNGKKNFGYLRPIANEQFFTNLEGLCSEDGQSWTPFKITFNCFEHDEFPVSKLIKFKAKIKSAEGFYNLGYNNKYTRFEPIEGDISQLVPEIMNFYDDTPISEIETIIESQVDKERFEIKSVMGQVYDKRLKEATPDKPYPWCSASIVDPDGNASLKILMHPGISNNVAFAEGDLVKCWGTFGMGKGWDFDLGQQTDEEVPTLYCSGLFRLSNIVDDSVNKLDEGFEE